MCNGLNPRSRADQSPLWNVLRVLTSVGNNMATEMQLCSQLQMAPTAAFEVGFFLAFG